jgi:archaellum component FlaC
MDKEFRQFIIDLKTTIAYDNSAYYGEVTEKLENINNMITDISENLRSKKEHVHEDDDNTHHVLKESLELLDEAMSNIYSAYTCFEDLKFYTGDGHKL